MSPDDVNKDLAFCKLPPLFIAVFYEQSDVVECLLRKKADPRVCIKAHDHFDLGTYVTMEETIFNGRCALVYKAAELGGLGSGIVGSQGQMWPAPEFHTG